MVPPQIESHPVDVLDAITGTEATFSISMCPLQQQTANGGVKSNRGQGQEGLQFGWEVLRAQSATKSTAANGSGELCDFISSRNISINKLGNVLQCMLLTIQQSLITHISRMITSPQPNWKQRRINACS